MNVELPRDNVVIRPADLDLLVSAWCSVWNEPDPERRLRRLATIWGDDATFDNASVHLRGLGQLDSHIGAFRSGCCGWRFVVMEVTAHGRHVHLSWRLVDAIGGERLAGHDVGELASDRRFDRVVSFWRPRSTG